MGNVKEHRILTPQYYKWYLNNKQNCRNYYKILETGIVNNRLNSIFEDQLKLWDDYLLNNIIPEEVENNLKAGRKRKGKHLPLSFKRVKK